MLRITCDRKAGSGTANDAANLAGGKMRRLIAHWLRSKPL
jgi:hypothetical protein